MEIVYFSDKLLINFLTNDAFCSYIYYNSANSNNNSGYMFSSPCIFFVFFNKSDSVISSFRYYTKEVKINNFHQIKNCIF